MLSGFEMWAVSLLLILVFVEVFFWDNFGLALQALALIVVIVSGRVQCVL